MASTGRRFRFGVTASFDGESTWREFALKAEDLGYSTLLIADHMGRQASPLIAAMAALSVTTRLRVGTQVLANPFRNPAVLAKEIASLDYLSGGRFEPGIGAGWPSSSPAGKSDSAQTGIDMGGNGERVERLAEAMQIIKLFLSEREPFDFKGDHFTVSGVVPFPPAVQRPHPPIMLAGAGPRMMRLAAREADIINIAPRPPTRGATPAGSMSFGLTMADEIALIKEAAGERYEQIEICVLSNNPTVNNPSVTDQPEESINALAKLLAISPAEVWEMPATLIGTVDDLIERIQLHREQYDISYRIIPAYAMEQFAPIVKALTNT
jgi:probable F420-dependent oxidoreductase